MARFDCQDRADWLSPKRLAAWLTSVGYCGRIDPAVLHAPLAAPRGLTGADGAAQAHVTRALLATLSTVVEQIKAPSEQIAEQLALRADAHIFTSLPRSGTVRAARLLAEIGDWCPLPTPACIRPKTLIPPAACSASSPARSPSCSTPTSALKMGIPWKCGGTD